MRGWVDVGNPTYGDLAIALVPEAIAEGTAKSVY
jgi:hypothetical protein